MKHLGDITAISGYDAPPVDVVIGGSPCQDLSIAGRRAGLAGARSGLFMEQIRIVKEMRDADIRRGRTGQLVRPRFMVWENVPGAFSSNRGEDFRAVLEEVIRIAKPDAPDVPLPPQGRWPLADCWFGDGWSVAYRVLDAQFWGVPQRRRRIALVADLGGHAAPEILFVRKSVCGDIETGGAAGEAPAAGTESGAYPAVARSLTARHDGSPCIDRGPNIVMQGAVALRMRAGCEGGGKGALVQVEKSGTLGCVNDQTIFCAGFKPHAGASAGNIGYEAEVSPTIDTGKPMAVYDARGNGDGETICTLTGDRQDHVTDYTALVLQSMTPWEGQARRVFGADGVFPSLASRGKSGQDQQSVLNGGLVRRLTPLECERLQGFPDGWTDIGPWEKTDKRGKTRIVPCADSLRYRALGNSIALPPWTWLLKRLCACYERPATMASLFDGIGGFPLIWERLNGPGTCLWASEIEQFPIAVTRAHFGGASNA